MAGDNNPEHQFMNEEQMMMKKVTIRLDDNLYFLIRMTAQRHNLALSRVMNGCLEKAQKNPLSFEYVSGPERVSESVLECRKRELLCVLFSSQLLENVVRLSTEDEEYAEEFISEARRKSMAYLSDLGLDFEEKKVHSVTLFIKATHCAWLNKQAKTEGLTHSDVIRNVLRHYLMQSTRANAKESRLDLEIYRMTVFNHVLLKEFLATISNSDKIKDSAYEKSRTMAEKILNQSLQGINIA
jgi:hypothetical protein